MSEKKPPNPEEIQKEFEDFVKQRFGGQVQVFSHAMSGDKPLEEAAFPEASEEKAFSIDFDMKPKDVKKYLDKYVIRQDDAKRALSIAICDHYNHVKMCHKKKMEDASYKVDYAKQNVMVLGPTGVGKTYMIRKIADLIGVPFIKADATRFSETGYVGSNVDDLIRDLVNQADGNIEKAQYGIVYLDEIDKLAGNGQGHGRDVTGRGVQFGLLKLMEETEVDLKAGNDMQSQIQAMMDLQKGNNRKRVVNTGNILFIVSGAFTGLEEIIKKRLKTNAIGFRNVAGLSKEEEKDLENDRYLAKATTQDLIDFGFEPEFIGRLPVQVACHHLGSKDLFKILTESKGSIIYQYKRAFDAYGIKATFSDEALLAIAKKASLHKTGARALMTECEELLRDFKFELPSSHVEDFLVDEACVLDPEAYLKNLLAQPNNKILNSQLKSVLAFEEEFENTHGIKIRFTQEAAESIAAKATATSESVEGICRGALASYDHGLKLVQQSTGKAEFELGVEVLESPKKLLERLISEAFASRKGASKSPKPSVDILV